MGSGGAGQPWGIPSLITGVEEKIVFTCPSCFQYMQLYNNSPAVNLFNRGGGLGGHT